MDNEKLHERVIALEHRLQSGEEPRSSKNKEECPEGSDVCKIILICTWSVFHILEYSVYKFTDLCVGCRTRSFSQTNGIDR